MSRFSRNVLTCFPIDVLHVPIVNGIKSHQVEILYNERLKWGLFGVEVRKSIERVPSGRFQLFKAHSSVNEITLDHIEAPRRFQIFQSICRRFDVTSALCDASPAESLASLLSFHTRIPTVRFNSDNLVLVSSNITPCPFLSQGGRTLIRRTLQISCLIR